METFITRQDDNVGYGTFDSIAWALSEHVGCQDKGEYQSAILYGNEDAPDQIDFYTKIEPLISDKPHLIWFRSNK